jgi:hypothetical protein
MQDKKTPLLFTILLLVLLASPARARFEPGTFRLGAGLGFRGSSGGITFSIGAAGGVFVLKGLDFGISTRWLFYPGEDPAGDWYLTLGLVLLF